MAAMDDLKAQIAVLTQRQTEHERRQAEHERSIDEFMEETRGALRQLLSESSQWAGARQTFTLLVTMLTLVGGAVGFGLHWFWPNGASGR